MKDYINIKVWKKTRNRLRLLAALVDKSMLECLDDLVEEKMKGFDEPKKVNVAPNSDAGTSEKG